MVLQTVRGEARRFGCAARHLAGGLLLLAVGGLLGYGFWPVLVGQAQDEPTQADADGIRPSRAVLDAIVVRQMAFPVRTHASGHLIPWREAPLRIDAAGPVVERSVEEGDRVEAGDLILRVDDREEHIALEEARADVLQAQAAFAVEADAPRHAAASDTTELAAARTAYRAARDAFAQGDVSRADLEAARRRYEAARVGAGLERDAVQAARTGLIAAEQALARARLNLERTRVTAPFDGRVANLSAQVGQRVSPGDPLGMVLQDRRLKVEVDVLEADVVRIRKGAPAQVHVPALDGRSDKSTRLDGTVWTINPKVDATTGTARVTVALPNPDRRLVAGLHATVRLETQRLNDRLVVPDAAVLVRQGRDLVFVVEDGRAQWRYVDVGTRSGHVVTITQGVHPGDTVAVSGHYALAHDAPVTVETTRTLAVE